MSVECGWVVVGVWGGGNCWLLLKSQNICECLILLRLLLTKYSLSFRVQPNFVSKALMANSDQEGLCFLLVSVQAAGRSGDIIHPLLSPPSPRLALRSLSLSILLHSVAATISVFARWRYRWPNTGISILLNYLVLVYYSIVVFSHAKDSATMHIYICMYVYIYIYAGPRTLNP